MNRDAQPSDLFERIFLVTAAAIGLAAGLFLTASALAAKLFGDGPLGAGITEAAAALCRLPSHLGDPAGAWDTPFRQHLPGPVGYWTSLGIVLGAALALAGCGLRVWRLRRNGREPLGVPTHVGIAGRLRSMEVSSVRSGRLTLGRVGGRLVAAEADASVAVVGPSGCGKTAGFAVPALLEWDGPVIATSVKTDLVAAALAQRQAMGTVWVYDPTGCSGVTSHRWSPLAVCGSWAGAQRMAAWLCEAAESRRSSVTDADYWQTQARIALAPHLYAAACGGRTMADVVRWIDTEDHDDVRGILQAQAGIPERLRAALAGREAADLRATLTPPVRAEVIEMTRYRRASEGGAHAKVAMGDVGAWPADWRAAVDQEVAAGIDAAVRAELTECLLRRPDRASAPLTAAEALWAKEERLRCSVYATIQNVLVGYADPAVADAAAGCDLDLDQWLAGPNTIFVVAPHHDQARLRPILTVLVQQAVRHAYDTANRNGGRLPRPALVLLDEAGNVAPLRDLPAYAATARSHGISLVSVWQDLAQVRAVYGEMAPVVLNNHRARVFGSGIADAGTLDYVSRLVGDVPVTEQNRSTGPGGSRSVSEHTTFRRAAPVDVLRRLPAGEALLVYGAEPPARLRLRPYFQVTRKRRGLRWRPGGDTSHDQRAATGGEAPRNLSAPRLPAARQPARPKTGSSLWSLTATARSGEWE